MTGLEITLIIVCFILLIDAVIRQNQISQLHEDLDKVKGQIDVNAINDRMQKSKIDSLSHITADLMRHRCELMKDNSSSCYNLSKDGSILVKKTIDRKKNPNQNIWIEVSEAELEIVADNKLRNALIEEGKTSE